MPDDGLFTNTANWLQFIVMKSTVEGFIEILVQTVQAGYCCKMQFATMVLIMIENCTVNWNSHCLMKTREYEEKGQNFTDSVLEYSKKGGIVLKVSQVEMGL